MNASTNYIAPNQYPFTNGNAPQVSISPTTTAAGAGATGIGPEEPGASPGDGLGSGASSTVPALGMMLFSMSALSLWFML